MYLRSSSCTSSRSTPGEDWRITRKLVRDSRAKNATPAVELSRAIVSPVASQSSSPCVPASSKARGRERTRGEMPAGNSPARPTSLSRKPGHCSSPTNFSSGGSSGISGGMASGSERSTGASIARRKARTAVDNPARTGGRRKKISPAALAERAAAAWQFTSRDSRSCAANVENPIGRLE